jgi:vacuolar-type H+-ATPase subunit I/STV1
MACFRVCALATTVMLVLSVAGCDTKHEAAQKKMTSLMSEYADVLEGIKSNADLVDAKPRLEKIGARMKDMTTEIKALPAPTADEQKALSQKFDADTRKVGDRISAQMQRLEKIGVSPFEVMGALKMDPGQFQN